MVDVAPLQDNLQEEELRSGAAASEDTMQKVAGSVNFWNMRFSGGRPFMLNGRPDILPFPQVGVDGSIFCPSNQVVYAFGLEMHVPGTAGDLEIDVIVLPADLSTPYSMFTVRPKIHYTAGAFARMGIDYSSGSPVVLVQSLVGITLPTFTSRNLNAGDYLICNIVSAPTAAESITMNVELRPR